MQKTQGQKVQPVSVEGMGRSSLAKSYGDVAETKRRISLALDRCTTCIHACYLQCLIAIFPVSLSDDRRVSRYGAFAGAIRRADVSAQISGAKVLENLASIAVLDQLLLRNSADLRFVLHSYHYAHRHFMTYLSS